MRFFFSIFLFYSFQVNHYDHNLTRYDDVAQDGKQAKLSEGSDCQGLLLEHTYIICVSRQIFNLRLVATYNQKTTATREK